MFPSLFGGGADVLRPIFPATVTNTARTPAGVSFARLSRASGLQITDRLLVIGILSAEALGALVAMGNSAVTLIRPERLYPSPAQADVERLLIELSAAEFAGEAVSLGVRLRLQGLQSVRIEELRPGVALVRGRAREQRRLTWYVAYFSPRTSWA